MKLFMLGSVLHKIQVLTNMYAERFWLWQKGVAIYLQKKEIKSYIMAQTRGFYLYLLRRYNKYSCWLFWFVLWLFYPNKRYKLAANFDPEIIYSQWIYFEIYNSILIKNLSIKCLTNIWWKFNCGSDALHQNLQKT